MDESELHYPPGAEPKAPAPEEAPKDEPKPEEAPAPEAPAPEAPKPGEKLEEKPDEPAPEPAPLKKRSIYDDLKDTRKELKETKARLKEREDGDKPADKPTDAPPPKDEPSDELDAYAKDNGLDAKALGRLAEIIAKRVPNSQLSETERSELASLKTWQTEQLAKEQRTAEDNTIKADAPKVKEQLQIHDDAELSAVMDEIVKLAHTPEFHDKEVEYIVWKNQATLQKLVSPKKPSFESGGPQATPEPAPEADFSSGKGITPGMAEKAVNTKSGSALEIRKGK